MRIQPTRALRKFYSAVTNRTLLGMSRDLAVFGLMSTGLYVYITNSVPLVGLIVLAAFSVTRGKNSMDVFLKTVGRDLRALKALLHFKVLQSKNVKHNRTIPIIFEEIMRRNPRKVAIQWENVSWTFYELFEYSNAIGNYFRDQGFRHGDVVSIFVENRPEFVALWLGLSRIGVTCSLINFNLRGDALTHCINISSSKAVIFSGQLSKAVNDVKADLKGTPRFYAVCLQPDMQVTDDVTAIDDVFKNGLRLPPESPKEASYFDKLLYIYTSGTTGLPKAAVITHCRYFYMCTMQHLMLGYRHDDSVYCSLPLYHSNGGIVGLGQCLCHGLTITVRTKFSASAFWTDCKKYQSTVILYIGEICRYLLGQPEKPSDRDHNVRVMTGNGLRPEIWTQFTQRFNVAKVAEFYGATEGNANMINIDNKVGSCGFVSVLAPSVYPITLLKIDEDKELIRGPDGLCIKCAPDEFGMLVGKIITESITQRYDGYADAAASKKKIAYDVFKKGDSVFMTGDVLLMDKYGYMYFKDRTGDTFRWKGENVSTAECEAEIAKVLDNQHTVGVYGVEIPGTEGRAGMACIMDPDKVIDMGQFYEGVTKQLVSYARPIFVRLCDHIEVTGTHKIKKVHLRKEGYDVNQVNDPVYFLDAAKKSYVLLDGALHQKIISGDIRV